MKLLSYPFANISNLPEISKCVIIENCGKFLMSDISIKSGDDWARGGAFFDVTKLVRVEIKQDQT